MERGEGGSFSDGYFTVRPPDIGCKNIFDRITSRLYLCNKGFYNELIQDFYGTAASYSGKARGNQNWEQRHHTFTNLIMRGKLREAVQFICDQETGGFLPANWATEKRVL